MNRKVYLVGEIEKKFGSVFSMNVDSYADIIKCIDCNRPGFREYLATSEENGIVFTINSAGKDIGEEDLLTPLEEGDVTIAAIPAGSKSDAARIIIGATLMIIAGPLFGPTGSLVKGSEFLYSATMALGLNLTMQGIQGMLSPDPSVDDEIDEGYLYTGGEALVVEGDPVPVLYGELRIPGQPISIALNTHHSGGLYSEYDESVLKNILKGIEVAEAGANPYETFEND